MRILAAVVGVAVIPFAGILAAAFVRFDLSKLSLEAPRFRTPEITLPWDTEQLASSDGGPKALGESSPDGGATSKREADIESTLVIGTREPDSGRPATAAWLNLLALDREAKRAAILSVPAHTAAEVPGLGLLPLTDAFKSGGARLLAVTVANLLGVDVDHHVELPREKAETVFRATGPLTVNLPADVYGAGSGSVSRPLFYAGRQTLSPAWQARLMFLRPRSADDIALGPLQLAEWDALLDRFRSQPVELEQAVSSIPEALEASDVSAAEHGRLLGELSALPEIELTLASLPVSDLGVSGGALYGTDRLEIDRLLERSLGFRAAGKEDVAVQVLNGNGVPGVGARVAAALVGRGYSVVLSGNARRLRHKKTLIVSHIDSPEGELAARRARGLLGAGRVEISSQGHGIVDLTIVVGKDFLRER